MLIAAAAALLKAERPGLASENTSEPAGGRESNPDSGRRRGYYYHHCQTGENTAGETLLYNGNRGKRRH
jgi:hypothetical protein